MTKILKIDEMVAVNEGQPIHMRNTNRPFDPQNNDLTRMRDTRQERAKSIKTARDLKGFYDTLSLYDHAVAVISELDKALIRAGGRNGAEGVYQYFKSFDAIKRITECDESDDTWFTVDFNTWMTVTFDGIEDTKKVKVSFFNKHGRDMSLTSYGLKDVAKHISIVDDCIAFDGEVIYDDGIIMFSPVQFDGNGYPNMINISVDLSKFRGMSRHISSKGFKTTENNGITTIEMDVENLSKFSSTIGEYLNRY